MRAMAPPAATRQARVVFPAAMPRYPLVLSLLVVAAAMLLDTPLGGALGRFAPGVSILDIGLTTGATLSILASMALWRLGW